MNKEAVKILEMQIEILLAMPASRKIKRTVNAKRLAIEILMVGGK